VQDTWQSKITRTSLSCSFLMLQVDGDGMLFCSYKQKLSPLATMTLAAQVNTVNLSDNKHQYGFILNITA